MNSAEGLYTAAAETGTGNWLKVSPERGAGGEIAVTVDPASLAPGDYAGTVSVGFDDPNHAPVKVPILLRIVESTVEFGNAPPAWFFLGRRTDPPPPPIQVDITGSKEGIPFRIDLQSSSDTGWLLIGPQEGVTPATLDITFDPRKLGQDSYRRIEVVLQGPSNTVVKAAAVSITDAFNYLDESRRFFWARTGGPAPASQAIPFSGSRSEECREATVLSPSTQTGGNWLSVPPAPGSNTITVQVTPGNLGAGVYEGAVSIAAPSLPGCPAASIPVTLFVSSNDPAVSVEPAAIILSAPSGSDASSQSTLQQLGYAPQVNVNVFATAQRYPIGFSFTASTENNLDWLIVSANSFRSPMILNVLGKATDLPPGTYRGAVRVNAPPESNNAVSIPVTFHVGPAAPANARTGPPLAASLVNAAAQSVGPIAPGELVTIHGVNLAPHQQDIPAARRPAARVLLGDAEAQIVYASPTQLNVLVPAALAGKKTAQVTVESQGLRSSTGISVAESAPGVFTVGGTGMGQAVALNLPSEEPNSAQQPAARGAGLRLFATGLGQTAQFTNLPLLPVSVKIANRTANIQSIAPAPAAAGVFQVDVVVPPDIAPGPAVPVVIEAGSASSPDWVTIAVK